MTTAPTRADWPVPAEAGADFPPAVVGPLKAGISKRLEALREIAATREIHAPRETIFGFLANLENHAALGRGSVELLSLKGRAGTASEAAVRLRGPLGIRRTATAAISGTRAWESIFGWARIGARTRAFVSWHIESAPHGSTVSLRAIVEKAGLREGLLLAFGGRWWLGRRFASALSCLSHQLAPTPAFVNGGDSALLTFRLPPALEHSCRASSARRPPCRGRDRVDAARASAGRGIRAPGEGLAARRRLQWVKDTIISLRRSPVNRRLLIAGTAFVAVVVVGVLLATTLGGGGGGGLGY
jgi:hypothetical protein